MQIESFINLNSVLYHVPIPLSNIIVFLVLTLVDLPSAKTGDRRVKSSKTLYLSLSVCVFCFPFFSEYYSSMLLFGWSCF